MDRQKRITLLEQLLRDYHTASQIGAAMEDQTPSDEQDYARRMQALQQRAAALLGLDVEESLIVAAMDSAANQEASQSLKTFYVHTNIYGGHVQYLVDGARENGVQLLAVNGVSVEDLTPEQMGFREGPGSYLFLVVSHSLRKAEGAVDRARRAAGIRLLAEGAE